MRDGNCGSSLQTGRLFEQQENETLALLSGSDGQDQVVIYLAKEHAMKRLGTNMTVFANNELVNELNKKLGEKNNQSFGKVH